ncbi:hypothetical protein NDU88_001023 [Pleurodeles waltl]|uniref:Uncharacterized protein n=1 Tax=Pleurodeles waltl TaxID=8319 RepID=A0AAV7KRI4_PLEWA|nr:hypothetical protein NDU88_001023 [Pleurodeles waltl]
MRRRPAALDSRPFVYSPHPACASGGWGDTSGPRAMPLGPSCANLKWADRILHQRLRRPPFCLGAVGRPFHRTVRFRPSGGCFLVPWVPGGALLGQVVFHVVPATPSLHPMAELRSGTPIQPPS